MKIEAVTSKSFIKPSGFYKRPRRFFATLIELLIVISILGIITGAVGIGIFKAVREQQFQSEVSQVQDTLRLAQDLMLVRNADVSIKFTAVGDEIWYWIEFDQQGSKKWTRESLREPKKLKRIQYVDFQEVAMEEPVQGSAEIRFFSGGAVMSQGDLRLSTSKNDDLKGALTRYIWLAGYPSLIISKEEETPLMEDEEASVSEITRREIDNEN